MQETALPYRLRESLTSPHGQRLALLFLWFLVIMWNSPWAGDLRDDSLTYACFAKDMAENGRWLFPLQEIAISESPSPYWFDKPPLYVWFVAVSFKLFGTTVFASNLPALLFAALDIAFLYLLVNRLFGDRDLAFFSAFVFETTHWVFRTFSINRMESLLAFTVLLALYALILMERGQRKGPYLLWISFSAAFMIKLFFAFFVLLAAAAYALASKKVVAWLKWPHIYLGCLLAIALAAPWFVYAESMSPGYISYIVKRITLDRIAEGAAVTQDRLLYLKALLKYYHPWLLFLVMGIPLLWKKGREDRRFRFVLLALAFLYLPLQLSKGQETRYLTMVTPFMSVAAAVGVSQFNRVKKAVKGVALYAPVPLLLVFWLFPMEVHHEKFRVIHLAERMSRQIQPRESAAPPEKTRTIGLRLAEWRPKNLHVNLEFRQAYYFFLSDSFAHMSHEELSSWAHGGNSALLLLTYPGAEDYLPASGDITWTEMASDGYHILLMGMPGATSRRKA